MQAADTLELLHPIHQWLEMGLTGMASPWGIGIALVLTSFLLEDVSIAAAAALATQGTVSWEWAFAWVFAGIALGDIGLYAAGFGARSVPWLRRKYIEVERHGRVKTRLEKHLSSAILLARVVPGLRLVTYTLCGFARVPLFSFCLWVCAAVALWTLGLFWLGAVAGSALADTLHLPQPVAVTLPIIAVAIAVPLVKHFSQRKKTLIA
jgi:membrane protein DedA with SNARE-associated domain